jgi:ABC-2 type transport system permease protein
VKSYAPAAPRAAFPDPVAGVAAFASDVLTVADAEIRKLRHDPLELFMRAVQPTLWLAVFGQVMSRLRGVPTGRLPYLDFMAPGILAQSVLFIAIFYGVAAIRERDLGVLNKYMVSPISRTALILGKAISAGARALSQAVIVYALALLMGIHASWAPWHIAGVLVFVLLGSAVFSTISLAIACLVKNHERVMGMGQVMTMPLFFASNAIYPVALMPGWLRSIAAVNPLTYEVDGLRALMVQGGTSALGLATDTIVLLVFVAVLVAVSSRLYPRLLT